MSKEAGARAPYLLSVRSLTYSIRLSHIPRQKVELGSQVGKYNAMSSLVPKHSTSSLPPRHFPILALNKRHLTSREYRLIIVYLSLSTGSVW